MVEAAGIEYFGWSVKTIRYGAAVPKSCLKYLKLVGGLYHAFFGF